MEKVFNALNFFLSVISFTIVIFPALLILIVTDIREENRFINTFYNEIMQNCEA